MAAIEKIFYPNSGNQACYSLEDNSFWFRCRNKIIQHFVKTNLNSTERVFLDVGGGNGYITKMLEDSGFDARLVEPGEEGCLNGRARNLSHIFQGTFAQYLEEHVHEHFDVGLFDVIEHIEDDVGFLVTISQSQRVGAKLFITVPAYNFLWSYEDTYAGHFRRYTKARLEEVLNTAGYEVIDFSGFFVPLLPLIFIFRKLRDKIFGPKRSSPDTEHGDNIASRILSKVCMFEHFLISKGARFPFGSSLMIVASKT